MEGSEQPNQSMKKEPTYIWASKIIKILSHACVAFKRVTQEMFNRNHQQQKQEVKKINKIT